jgi:hypothetical protein
VHKKSGYLYGDSRFSFGGAEVIASGDCLYQDSDD